MKVLFWSEAFAPAIGGAEVWGARFVRTLTERDHEVRVLTGNDPNDDDRCRVEDGPTPVCRFPFWESLAGADRARVFAIREAVAGFKRAFRPDVVHLSSLGPSVFYHLVTREAWPAPTLVTIHGWIRHRPSPGTLLWRVLTQADWVVGVSHAVLRETAAIAPIVPARSSVVHHGIEWAEATPVPIEPPTLLCVGRLVRVKGFDVAVAAMPALRQLVPAARLVVAGEGPEAGPLRALARRLGVDDCVEFMGPVSPAGVPALLNHASLVLVPSRAEAFGLVALEAAAMGRPVIAARVGGLVEVVEPERTGVLVEPDQPAQLVEAVVRLLSDPARLLAMGQEARSRARTVFPWKACVDAYLDHYASLKRRRGHAG